MRLYHYNVQAVRVLLNCGVNLNVRNSDGHTAQDMLQEQTQENSSEIMNMLSCAGALSRLCLPKVFTCHENYMRKLRVLFYERSQIFRKTVLFFERLRIFRKKIIEWGRISNDDRNALLVVAALLITITYQVVLSPPGGLWQDDKISEGHDAGTAIAQTNFDNFEIVATINYITFTLSVIMTFLLLPKGYISALFKIALVQLWVSYYYSLGVICDSFVWVWR